MGKSSASLLLAGIASLACSSGLWSTTVLAQSADDFAGKRIVPVLQEPRHRIVHRDGELYLLDIQINPGDMTLPHTHDAAILYTFISNGEGPLGGRVSSNTGYLLENLTHEVANPGPGLFRIIALTNYGPEPEVVEDEPTGLGLPAELENRWFRSYRLTLAPGETSGLHNHSNPSVVVQVSAGRVHVSREDGITAELDDMGDWAWREAESAYRISNVSDVAVTLVVNEARL
jgi:quercetin dioxygenase-like cupin family protein